MSAYKPPKRPRRNKRKPPERRDVSREELAAIVERAKKRALSAKDVETLTAAHDTLAWLSEEIEDTSTRLSRLRKLMFGSSSEKTSDVLADLSGSGEPGEDSPDASEPSTDDGAEGTPSDDTAPSEDEKKKKKGHGRNGADAYPGATTVEVPHGALHHGDPCPKCDKGKVYRKKPSVLIRVRGVAPLNATRYELERLRCHLCGAIFVAEPPSGVAKGKYDESSAAMIALLRYGCGLPFNRQARLGEQIGIPMPPATQWEIVRDASKAFEPVWSELVLAAPRGEVVHNDDTHAMVLALVATIREEIARGDTDRTGIFTSAVVSRCEGREIALFFTGREHAGENLAQELDANKIRMGVAAMLITRHGGRPEVSEARSPRPRRIGC